MELTILALARNCAGSLSQTLSTLESMRGQGIAIQVIVGENGSTDSTREVIRDFEGRDLVRLVDTSFMAKETHRLRRMAMGRDRLRQEVKPRREGIVLVADVDGRFLSAIKTNSLLAAARRLLTEPGVYAIGATSRPTYYDLLAYEDVGENYIGLDERLAELRTKPWAYYRYFTQVVYPAQRRLTTDGNRTCISSFNGLALYRASDYVRGTYLSSDPGPVPCEHVVLHRSLAQLFGGHMVIDSALVVPTPPDHGPRSLTGFLLQRLQKARMILERQSSTARRRPRKA